MKNFFFHIVFLFIISNCLGQNNDSRNCIFALEYCNYAAYFTNDNSHEYNNGMGIQELDNDSSCLEKEHNSIWQKFTFKTSGTFGFDIQPYNVNGSNSQYTLMDYDFAVFGPNASCDNLGKAIRCSSYNAFTVNSTFTYTGMNSSETDTSEGNNGNGYVKWIDVKAGETYYLVIDAVSKDKTRPSGFFWTMTGTAKIEGQPDIMIPDGVSINLEQCDTDGILDLKTTFNLTKNTTVVLGNQTNTTVRYFANFADVHVFGAEIKTPSAYTNISNPQTIFVQLENNVNQCRITKEFNITVVDNNAKFTTTESAICDDVQDGSDTNGKAIFDFKKVTKDILGNIDLSGLTIQYFLTKNEALLGINPLSNFYYNTTPNKQSVFVTVSGTNYCSKEPQEIYLIVQQLPAKNSYTLTQCEVGTNPDGLTLYNLKEADLVLTNNDTNLCVQYFLNTVQETNNNPLPYNYTNTINPQPIIARITNKTTNCSSLSSLTLTTKVINEAPILLEECDILGQEKGFAIFNLNDANLGLTPTQTIKYYPSLNNALLEEKAITNFANYTNTAAYSESVYARVEDDNACYGIVEIRLKVNTLPIIATQGKDFLCANITDDTVILDAHLITGNLEEYSYKWFRNGQVLPQTTYGIQTNQTGTYTVEVTNSNNCSKTRTIEVVQSSTTTAIEVLISDVNTDFNSVTVSVTGTGKYSYSLNEPFGPFQTSNLFEKVPAGIHELYVYDENGCGVTSKTIAVIGIPKFFTPNADGFNDVWKIKGVDAIFNVATNVLIFDRYGKLLKQIPIGDYNGWDGNFNDKPLPADDYWYNINLADGRIVKGHFALKR